MAAAVPPHSSAYPANTMYASQVGITRLPFTTANFLLTALKTCGFHPISANMIKNHCVVQFANEEIAREVVNKLNFKLIPGAPADAKENLFTLFQGTKATNNDHELWVGNLTTEVDDYTLYNFFSARYHTLRNAKIVTDSRGNSRGCGFIQFSSPIEMTHCLKNMNGTTGLGGRCIKVQIVARLRIRENRTYGDGNNDRFHYELDRSGDPYWESYMNWNKLSGGDKFIVPKSREERKRTRDTDLIEYNVAPNEKFLNEATLQMEYNLWDALESSKWLPLNTYQTKLNFASVDIKASAESA